MTLANTYENVYQRGLRLARRRSPVEGINDIEDEVQNTFLRLLERGIDLDSLEKPESYVLKALQNLCIDHAKSPKRLKANQRVSIGDSNNDDEEERPMMELPDARRGPEMDAEIKIDNEKLLRILAEQCRDLTKRERDLLALHLQGYTSEEIANAWGEDVKVIRTDMNAVLAKIRYRLQHRNKGASHS